MRSQAAQDEHQAESAERVLSDDTGRVRTAAHVRALLRPAGAALLRAQEGVRRGLRGDLQAAVRDVPPPRDGQVAQRVALLVASALHRLDIVGRVRVRAPERGRDDLVVARLPQEPAARPQRAHGHCEDTRALQRSHARRVLSGPLSARQSAQHALLHQLLHLHWPRRAHRGDARAPEERAQDHAARRA